MDISDIANIFLLILLCHLIRCCYPNNPVTQATPFSDWAFWLYNYAAALIGIFIGIGFYSVARFVKENDKARSSLIIAGFGFIFYFTAAFATVIQTGYPPFGLANVSFVGLASFMIYAGLYNSAVSVSRDVQLRNMIKKSVFHEAKFLSSMGVAQMRHELEQTVLDITQKDLTNYLNQIISILQFLMMK